MSSVSAHSTEPDASLKPPSAVEARPGCGAEKTAAGSHCAGAELSGVARLSVLIPVFNWDVRPLVARLIEESDASQLGAELEILVMDDGSSDAALARENEAFFARNGRSYLRFVKRDCNVGRSAIRNILAAKATGSFLLFLDCDILPDRADFLRGYLEQAASDDQDVVCGGISYRVRTMKGAEYDYHAYLGNRKEVKPAAERNREPWRHILTSNIMVRKSVFQQTSFDERFTGYGYEDIEWGVRLAGKFRVLHIDNTASHLGLVTKARTYEKMRNSVGNYLLLREICPSAFHASLISRLVSLFAFCHRTLLRRLDRALGRCFLSNALADRYAFVIFQLNFAVLLALALKDPSLRDSSASSGAGR